MGSLLLIVLGIISLFYPAGNKFDTANTIYLAGACLIITILLAIYGFIKAISVKKTADTNKNLWSLPQGIALVWALWVSLSFFTSQTANVGYAEVIMAWAGVLLFVTAKTWLNDKTLVAGGLTLLVSSALYGIVLYLDSPHQRLFGLFYNPAVHTDAWPNAFALFILMLWPLFLFWKPQQKIAKAIKPVSISLSIAALLASFSRAGLIVFFAQLAGVAGIIMYRLIKTKAKINKDVLLTVAKKTGYAVIVTIVSLSITAGTLMLRDSYFNQTTPLVSDKIKFAKGEEVTSISERLHFWQGSIELSKSQPWFGYGPMSFSYIYRSVQPDWLEISDHPHNVFLKLAVESGIPAAVTLALIIIILFIRTIRNWSKLNPKTREPLMILWLAFGGGLLHNQVDYNLNFVTNTLIWWILLSAILIKMQLPRSENHQKNQENFYSAGSALLTIITLACALSFLSLSLYPSLSTRITDQSFPLENKTFFPRYALLEEGDRARDQNNQQRAHFYYELHIKKNPIDATGYTRIGEMYRKEKDYQQALIYFEKALSRDRKNHWIHYRNYIETLVAMGQDEILQSFVPELIAEIEQYLPKIKSNLHYAAQKSDPLDLLALLEIMEQMDKNNTEKYKEYEKVIHESIEKYK